MRIDERLGVISYVNLLARELDGRACFALTVASVIALIDLISGLNVIPLRETDDFGKAIVLLLFSPLISFLVIIVLRQLPFSSSAIASLARAIVGVAVFFVINF